MSQLSLINDAINSFLDADNGFAEEIEYWPSGAIVAREIKALVDRNPPARIEEDRRNIVQRTVIDVANHATYGISATEVNRGTDRVKIAMRVGGTLEFRVIAKILSQDAGMLQLEIQ